MVLDWIFLRGLNSGNLIDGHMMVRRYWFPVLVFGSGLTQSTEWLKGSLIAGIGCSGSLLLDKYDMICKNHPSLDLANKIDSKSFVESF